jgi:hypothetical protein
MRFTAPPRIAVLAVLALAVIVGGCGGSSLTAPPDSASARTVLETYLQSLVAGDCTGGRVLGTAAFVRGNGDLCGGTSVTAWTINKGFEGSTPAETEFNTTLTTTGTGDGTVPAGDVTWFFVLRQQPNGAWRLVGGGTGP